MKILINKHETKDNIFNERQVDYSINLSKVGETLEVEIPDFFTIKTVFNGEKNINYIADVNGYATNIKEDDDGNLVIFSNGNLYPVKITRRL